MFTRLSEHVFPFLRTLGAPTPKDVLCNPAAGTCGFLMVAGEYLREHHANLFADPKLNGHFHRGLFHGF